MVELPLAGGRETCSYFVLLESSWLRSLCTVVLRKIPPGTALPCRSGEDRDALHQCPRRGYAVTTDQFVLVPRTQRSTSAARRPILSLHGVVFATLCPGPAVHRLEARPYGQGPLAAD